MLEIMVSCTVLLQFKHESLFPWTQICIKYYRENPLDEKHVFQLPVSSALVKKFCQDSHPEVWKVDISSGHGPKEVKTTWQVSTNPPVEHMMSNNTGLLSDSTVNAGIEEKMYFITVVKCSQVPYRFAGIWSLNSCNCPAYWSNTGVLGSQTESFIQNLRIL
ncbi:protein zwilch homolog isoform 6-T7 [Amazona ochrocephala]